MTKAKLTRLIHIAKSQLKLDDDTYRAMLVTATGKDSCRKMHHYELKTAYDTFVERGFKRSFKKHKQRVKPRLNGQDKAAEIGKIRAIWITMHQHGFIVDSSEEALNKFVQRQTARLNNGIGVNELGWLDSELAYRVLESLKQWHLRMMLEGLRVLGKPLPERRGYDAVCEAFGGVQ
ncbi:gp16 family protein [Providencia sp. 2024EL-00606]|uniref:gp16 family protein n=1 Tax=Providencia sp. 2024EL-00606 TaxID=3350765 RepID=UPI0024AC0BBA|nr:regulatory protein GemA [Providencia rettgeri]MDX4118126.1 regulatory protein GemA [Providencia rettgeri]